MKIDLNEIGIGIKCFPNFSIPCKFGQVIDDILNSEDSIFDSDFFPRVTVGSLDTLLHGDESNNFLRLSHEGAFVSVHPKKYLDPDSTIQLVTDFQKNVAERLVKGYKLKRIHQIGIIKKYTTEKINDTAIKQFIERVSFNNAYFVDMAFGGIISNSRIKPPKDSFTHNYIKLSRAEQDGPITFSFDVQFRFPDETDDISDIDFIYLNRCHATLIEEVFTPWLRDNFEAK